MWRAWLSIHSPAVEQSTEGADLGIDPDAEERLEGVDGGQLVGDRADPADPRDDVEDLVRRAPDDEPLEVARRLEDPEAGLDDLAVADPEPQAALALDAGQLLDREQSLVRSQGRHSLVTAVHRVPSWPLRRASPGRRREWPRGTARPSR